MVTITRGDSSQFMVSRTEVTYGEWLQVLRWSLLNGYDYAGHGYATAGAQLLTDLTNPARAKFVDSDRSTTPGMSQGGFDHPVTGVNYYDAGKWCNALSEMLSNSTVTYNPVYHFNGVAMKTGEGTGRPPHDSPTLNGFRMPTPAEYALLVQGLDLTPAGSGHLTRTAGNMVSARVASYPVASDDGIYDLIGNAWELSTLDAWGSPSYWHTRIYGPGYDHGVTSIQASIPWRHYVRQYNVGFRLARELP